MKFEIGDIVRVKIDNPKVKLESVIEYVGSNFYNLEHISYSLNEDQLELIERPKKKVKRTYWFVSFTDGYEQDMRFTSFLYKEKARAEATYKNKVDCQVHSIEILEESDE